MRYLITGGCGFLGSNLADEVMQLGEELVIFDNLARYGSMQNLEWLQARGKFKFIHGDVSNQNDVENVIRSVKPDVIFHLAGQVAMTTSLARPRYDFEINTLGTLNVLEAIRQFCPECTIIYSSTNKVYGDLAALKYEETATRYIVPQFPNGFPESMPLEFHSPYGCSKGAADQYILDYSRMFGLKGVVFRHSSMYGGRQFSTYDQGWVGWFCQQALLQKNGQLTEAFTISGNGKQVRDVLHAEDMKKLYFSAVKHIEVARGQAFNIGGGVQNSLSLLELFDVLEKIVGVQLKYMQIKPRESDQKVFVADIAKAFDLLRWQPDVSVKNGIEMMLTWLQT